MTYIKGDIIYGSKNEEHEAYHPIIFWESGTDESNFFGLFLTSQKKRNVPLLHEHIVWLKPQKGNSNFPNRLLIKKSEWGPFTKIGYLTKLGLSHVESHLSPEPPASWDNVKSQILGTI